MRALPPYEQATLDLDLPVIEGWVTDNADLVAGLVVDRAGFEPLSQEVWALDGGPTRISSTWPDPATGTLYVALDRVDPAFTARLEALAPDRIHVLPDPQEPAAPLASSGLPPYEQATLDLDLPVIEAWAADHAELVAEVNVDRDAFDSNVGHVVLVVEVHDHTAVRRTQAALGALLQRPEHLRVRV